MATRTSAWSPGVVMSDEPNWIWNAETPWTVPAGARISAGKSGRVARSFPSTAVALVNRSPVSCMPSPESPANRMTTRSFSSTVFSMILDIGVALSRLLDRGAYAGVRAASKRNAQRAREPVRRMFVRSSRLGCGPMRTRRLGSNGPDVTVIGFGAWEAGGDMWGANESEEAVIVAMRAGFDAGMNWIDTAEVYGKGVSEGIVGRAVAGRRDQVLVASKLAPASEGSGFRPEQVRAGCEGVARTPGHRRDRPLPAPLARRDGRADRGHVGCHGRAPGRRHGAVHRRLELRPGADRAMRGDPPRGFAPAGVLDAGARATAT